METGEVRPSRHGAGPFVAVNCSAIQETLFESEMFGIEKGVATGVTERIGKLEQAKGGTIFLDKIGEMSFFLQAKMLRAAPGTLFICLLTSL